MSRPEHQAPPEFFYNEKEAQKYTFNSRMIQIQTEMTKRALELLQLTPETCHYLLDLGCGSGLSGEVLTEEGHYWIGLDIAPAMLAISKEREVEGDVLRYDLGQGVSFRPGTFDGAISISALQWLCNADKTSHVPKRRLLRFFETLYMCLRQGARAVFQFYPENPEQIELVTSCAMRVGFTGGLVVDFPNSSKAKKYFLCLFAGCSPSNPPPTMPRALDTMDMNQRSDESYRKRQGIESRQRHEHRSKIKHRDWVLRKKEAMRRKGYDVPADSIYSGRSRGPKF